MLHTEGLSTLGGGILVTIDTLHWLSSSHGQTSAFQICHAFCQRYRRSGFILGRNSHYPGTIKIAVFITHAGRKDAAKLFW